MAWKDTPRGEVTPDGWISGGDGSALNPRLAAAAPAYFQAEDQYNAGAIPSSVVIHAGDDRWMVVDQATFAQMSPGADLDDCAEWRGQPVLWIN